MSLLSGELLLTARENIAKNTSTPPYTQEPWGDQNDETRFTIMMVKFASE
jgi:hypothetical protein